MEPPRVSIVVVNYNGQEHLAECLAALLADTAISTEICVVDNASTDDSTAVIEACLQGGGRFTFLRCPANRGYAAGVNYALPHLSGQYLAVLNSDVVVDPGWLAPVTSFLDACPEAGAINPLVILYADETRINAAGQNIHVTGLGFNRGLRRLRVTAGTEPQAVSGLHGSAFVIRREILAQAGGWDESGFLYHEDVELSWLLHLMGYDLYCLPLSTVRHKYHLSMYPEKLYLLERNRLAMLVTHLQPRNWLLLAPWLVFTEMLMWGFCCLRGWRFLKAKAASYLWVSKQWPAVMARRGHIQSLRRRPDSQILKRLKWNYDWDQFITLGKERGPSRRQPKGGLPVNLKDAL
jgi:GT2 family glycosyltransferase